MTIYYVIESALITSRHDPRFPPAQQRREPAISGDSLYAVKRDGIKREHLGLMIRRLITFWSLSPPPPVFSHRLQPHDLEWWDI